MDFFLFISKHFLFLSATTPYPLFLFILYLNCCFLWYYLLNAPSFFSGWVWCSGRELEADWKNINGHIYVHSYHYYSFFLTFLIGRFSSFYSSLWWSDDEVFFHWTKRNAAASSCVIVLFLASLYVNYNSYYVQFKKKKISNQIHTQQHRHCTVDDVRSSWVPHRSRKSSFGITSFPTRNGAPLTIIEYRITLSLLLKNRDLFPGPRLEFPPSLCIYTVQSYPTNNTKEKTKSYKKSYDIILLW